MLSGLLIIIVPLFTGYFVRFKNDNIMHKLSKLSMYLLYGLLFIMGYKLGHIENIFGKFGSIAQDFFIITIVLHIANFIFLIAYDVLHHSKHIKVPDDIKVFDVKVLIDICTLLSYVIGGFIIGYYVATTGNEPFNIDLSIISNGFLVILIFVVGMMLGNSKDVNMKMILLNKQGIFLSIYFTISSLLGGVALWLFFDFNLIKALGFASGMGWYSLSSVVISSSWGPVDGSVALFVDLSRELAALILVPILMKNFPCTAITQPGCTSLDCSLPIIQKAGGLGVVPLAISFGFLVNLYTPILLVIFTGLPVA